MPLVRIKTGFLKEDGREEILTEYLCDWPECGNVAEHVLGVAPDVGSMSVACNEHVPKPGNSED
jgi:hypothetical protein